MKKILYTIMLIIWPITLHSCVASYQSKTEPSPVSTVQTVLSPISLVTTTTPTVSNLITPSQEVVPTEKLIFQTIPFEDSQWKYFPLIILLRLNIYPVYRVLWDEHNRAWVYSASGLFLYDGADGSWKQILQNSGYAIAIGKEGQIWLGTTTNSNKEPFKGVAQYDGSTWKYFPLPGDPSDIAIGLDGKVWVSYFSSTENDAGVMAYDGITWKSILIGEGIQRDQIWDHQDDVWSLAVTSDNSIWFGTESDGFFRLKDNKWTHFPLQSFPEALSYVLSGPFCVKDMSVAPDGTLWGAFGTGGGAILHFTGDKWETYPYPYYQDSGIKAVTSSKEGRVWVGESFGRVLSFMDNGHWYTFQDLPFHSVYDISIAPDESVWVATYNGLFVYYPPN
jgi:ligand-binding sensor domain-containing protein